MADNIFLFNKGVLRQNFCDYRALGSVCYPLKANSARVLLKALIPLLQEDGKFSISSVYHYKILKSLHVEADKMAMINLLESRQNIKFLYDEGVRFFTFDSPTDLQDFASYADDEGCKISLRLGIEEAFNVQSHLGAKVEEVKKMLTLARAKFSDVGISFYLPYEIKERQSSMEKMIDFIIENFAECKLDFVVLAGLKEGKRLDKNCIDRLKRALNLKTVYLEPGQYLLENVFDLESKIVRVREGERCTVVIKNGIFSGFLDRLIYNKRFDIALPDGITLEHGKRAIDIYGGSGDSADYIGRYYSDLTAQQLLERGQLIIKNVGAYFEEFYLRHGGDIRVKYKLIEKEKNYEI